MIEEKRQYERYAISLDVEVIPGKEKGAVRRGTTVNFSRAGMCLRIPDPVLSLRGAVNLKVKLPDGEAVTIAAGDIMWARGDRESCCYGIKIIVMNKEDKFRILDYCRDMQLGASSSDFSVN